MNARFILLASIACLVSASAPCIPHSAQLYHAQPAFGDDDPLDIADVRDFTNRDVNRIVGNITRALARKAPWVDVLDGGTMPSGVSDTVRSIVQERAVLNQSLVRPEFRPDLAMCGKTGEAAEVGSTEYDYSLGTNRGMGPLVCVKQTRNAFTGSYMAAEESLKKQIIQLVNSDVRATIVDRSGCKLVVHTSKSFEQMFTGEAQAIDTPFTTDVGLPDAAINFDLLEYLSIFMRENLLVEGFEGTQSEPLLRFIGSQEIITKLRDDANIRDDHRYLAAGSYTIGEKTLTRYTWEGPYRGYAFGIDPQPMRFSNVDTDGQPLFIEPEIAVQTNQSQGEGVAARINPAWATARFEIGVVMGANSFSRLTPEADTGEGSFKFPAQLSMGELKFRVIEDNGNNVWADYGRHFYQVRRAYRPLRPHAVCAIAFKRRNASFNLTAISDYAGYSTANSL